MEKMENLLNSIQLKKDRQYFAYGVHGTKSVLFCSIKPRKVPKL